MISKEKVEKEYDELLKHLNDLRDAWDVYRREMFMAGKVEAADVYLYSIKKTFKDILEADDGKQ